MENVVEANNQATTAEIQALYNSSGEQKPISLRTTRRTLKRLGYSHSAQRQDSLVLAGLEALAVYASHPEQADTSTETSKPGVPQQKGLGAKSPDLQAPCDLQQK